MTQTGSAEIMSRLAEEFEEHEHVRRPILRLERLLRYAQGLLEATGRRRIGMRYSKDPSVEVRTGRRWLGGYRVEVNAAFIEMLWYLTELFVLPRAVVSRAGDPRQAGHIDSTEYLSILHRYVEAYVSGSDVELSHVKSAALRLYMRRLEREMLMPEAQRQNFIKSGTLLFYEFFIMSHEVGHVVSGHCDSRIPDDESTQVEEELEADRIAAELLNSFLLIPPSIVGVAEAGLQPEELEVVASREDIATAYARHQTWNGDDDPYPDSPYNIQLAVALHGISFLFFVYDAIEKTRIARGLRRITYYPSAEARYENFRTACSTFVAPERFTDSFGGIVGSPNATFEGHRSAFAGAWLASS